MLKEVARRYYLEKGMGCAEAIAMAGDAVYHLGLNPESGRLFRAYAGGMGCGGTCGALTGSLAVLGAVYDTVKKPREGGLRADAAAFVSEFEEKLGSAECSVLTPKYKTEQFRCVAAVELAADLLEEHIARITGVGLQSPVTVSVEDIKRVKALGCLQCRGTDNFNVRVITRNGKITNAESRCITEAAEKFGSGEVAFTTRLTVEIQCVPYDKIEELRAYLATVGLETGGTGSKVRPVVSCKGTTCQYGLYDTYAFSDLAHETFFNGYAGVKLPHKFKIAFGGCPNNCVKPDLNDFGVVGQRIPAFDSEKCRGCKSCAIEKNCPIHAASVKDGKLFIDPELCNHCGRCVGKCPFHATDTGTAGYKVFIGGRWGKKVAHGRPIGKIFTSQAEVMSVLEKSILLFREQGVTGERFSDTIDRIGFENVEAQLLGDEILARKAEILGAEAHMVGGATC